jgi:hypothetical protein
MPITRKGPGNPGKVASKMTKTSTGKLKDVFTNISNKIKAEQAGRDQVKKYKESLKQQKLAEQKAQKDLQLKERGGKRGKMSVSKEVKVKGKNKTTYERGQSKMVPTGFGASSTYYANKASIPTDSLKFMQQMAATNPGAARSFEKFMKEQQAKYPGARFTFSGRQSVSSDAYKARPGERPKNVPGKKGMFEYVIPQVTTSIPKKKGKKQ